MLSEISLPQKDKYCMISLTRGTQSSQIHRDNMQNSGFQGLWGDGDGKLLFNGYGFSVWDDENILEMDSGDGCTMK